MELYARIRRAAMVDGLSRRDAAKQFGVHRNTITKMLQFSIPPGYRRRERPVSKKLGPHMAWIDSILEGDRSVHKKQRHTAHRIFERLRDERGFSGQYTIVREYVAKVTLRGREMFVPLSHRPGHAQADFGEADGYIAGKKVRFHYFCMDLPHSDGGFVKAYPAETAEAFCDGPLGFWASPSVAGLPHRTGLLSVSCSSAPSFASGFLPTPPRDDAVAFRYRFRPIGPKRTSTSKINTMPGTQ